MGRGNIDKRGTLDSLGRARIDDGRPTIDDRLRLAKGERPTEAAMARDCRGGCDPLMLVLDGMLAGLRALDT
jgi:hypothetical protein